MKTLNDISLRDLIPDSLGSDKTVSNAIEAIDPQLKLIAENADVVLIYARLDDLTSLQLDHLATQFHIASWDSTWSRERKLLVLKATIETKRRRGTLLAVKEAVGAILDGYSWIITEWWETDPQGDPYTFDIGITLAEGQELSAEDQIYLENVVYEAKSIRSHNTITIGRKYSSDILVGANLNAAVYGRVVGKQAPITTKIFVGSFVRPASYGRVVGTKEPLEFTTKVTADAVFRPAVFARLT